MNKQLFKDDVIKSALNNVEPIYKKLFSALKVLNLGSPEKLNIDEWDSEKDGEIWGLRLQLKNPMNPAHSGWINSKSSKSMSNVQNTRIGCLINNSLVRLEQFTLALERSQEQLFVAIGPHAKNALEAIIDAEKNFKPENFDKDGFSKYELDDAGKPISINKA